MQINLSYIRKPFQSWLLIDQHSVSAIPKHAVYMAPHRDQTSVYIYQLLYFLAEWSNNEFA